MPEIGAILIRPALLSQRPLPFRDSSNSSNLFGIPGAQGAAGELVAPGRVARPPILLQAHTDVNEVQGGQFLAPQKNSRAHGMLIDGVSSDGKANRQALAYFGTAYGRRRRQQH